MFNIGFQELLIIAIIALLIVGPKKLPDLAKTLGKTFGEVRRATEDITDGFKKTLQEDEDKPEDDGLKDSLLMKKPDDEAQPESEEKNKGDGIERDESTPDR